MFSHLASHVELCASVGAEIDRWRPTGRFEAKCGQQSASSWVAGPVEWRAGAHKKCNDDKSKAEDVNHF